MGIGEQRVDGPGVGAHCQSADHGPDDPAGEAVGTAFDDRVQAVLLPQGTHGGGRAGRDGGDAPGLAGDGGGVLRVEGLVGPVEGAEPEVHDAWAQSGRVDGRPQAGRQPREGPPVQAWEDGYGAHQSCTEPSRRRATGR